MPGIGAGRKFSILLPGIFLTSSARGSALVVAAGAAAAPAARLGVACPANRATIKADTGPKKTEKRDMGEESSKRRRL
ncbi:MAG: hypothetical protein EBR51_04865 [Gammaproteobacteria bacterium]|nr:hypothetical protein [Gammaproteobacteria bacterium]